MTECTVAESLATACRTAAWMVVQGTHESYIMTAGRGFAAKPLHIGDCLQADAYMLHCAV